MHVAVRSKVWPVRRVLAVSLLLSALVAACSGSDVPLPCPQPVRVIDASRLVKFKGLGRDLTDVQFEAMLTNLEVDCEYDDGVVEAELRVIFEVARGPAALQPSAPFRYFVAIATQDQSVLAREEFDLEVPFGGNNTRIAVAESLEPRIPLEPGQDGAAFRIYVGFVLSEEELFYNRQTR